jgi:hypothetical protein
VERLLKTTRASLSLSIAEDNLKINAPILTTLLRREALILNLMLVRRDQDLPLPLEVEIRLPVSNLRAGYRTGTIECLPRPSTNSKKIYLLRIGSLSISP